MKYHVEVKVREGGNDYAWRYVRPTGGDPYLFSKEQAEDYVRTHILESGMPDAYRIVPASAD